MARPTVYQTSRVDHGKCQRCGAPLPKGSAYVEVKFRYGPKLIRCTKPSCRFRDSDLTQSKMSGVYAVKESVEDSLESWSDADELATALNEAADSAESVADEYEDNRSNMPDSLQDGPTGEEMQEKADAIREWAEALRDAASEIESEEEPTEVEDCSCGHTHESGSCGQPCGCEKYEPSVKDDPNSECTCGHAVHDETCTEVCGCDEEVDTSDWRSEIEDKVNDALSQLSV